jgi:hypothetical protein
MKAAFVFLLFVSAIFAQTVVLNIGGTTCIPDEADTCTPRAGSTRIELTGGVSVDTDNVCEAGAADTWGVATEFTTEEDGFYTVVFRGLGVNDESAVLLFEGEATADAPCDAVVATATVWSGFLPAATYTAVVTSNGGAADACGEFGATVIQTEYEFMGVTDTQFQPFFNTGGFCGAQGSTAWAFMMTFTPEADGTFTFFGTGRMDGEDTGFVIPNFVIATDDLGFNITNITEICDNADSFIVNDLTAGGYVLTGGVEYTVALYDFDTAGEIMVWANANEVAEVEFPECDNMDYDDQADFLRPNVPAVSVTTECEEGTSEHQFDVRITSFETDQFVVVDTVGCANPDETRSNVDGAVILYYGAVGTERDGDTPAVAPEDVCENFIIAGDSGDGGAVFYWFPANEDLTIVPTTYSSSGSGVYTLTVQGYDIVGCVPANPFLPEPIEDPANILTFVASALIFIALL